jgi:hypothetical protein
MSLHASNAIGDDRALCGLSDDAFADRKATGVTEETTYAQAGETVTCEDCQRIIAHVHRTFTVAYRVRK